MGWPARVLYKSLPRLPDTRRSPRRSARPCAQSKDRRSRPKPLARMRTPKFPALESRPVRNATLARSRDRRGSRLRGPLLRSRASHDRVRPCAWLLTCLACRRVTGERRGVQTSSKHTRFVHWQLEMAALGGRAHFNRAGGMRFTDTGGSDEPVASCAQSVIRADGGVAGTQTRQSRERGLERWCRAEEMPARPAS